MAQTQSLTENNNRALSLEDTFHDLLLSIKKTLITYIHLLFRPHKVIKFITSNENTNQSTYISPIALLIVSAFISAGFIKSLVFDTINDVNAWSIEAYDNYIRDYNIFSNIIFVAIITVASVMLAMIICLTLLIIIRQIETIPLKHNSSEFLNFFMQGPIQEFKAIFKLQCYYISLYLIITTIFSFLINTYPIDESIVLIVNNAIEIMLTAIASISFLFAKNINTDNLNYKKAKKWLSRPILRFLLEGIKPPPNLILFFILSLVKPKKIYSKISKNLFLSVCLLFLPGLIILLLFIIKWAIQLFSIIVKFSIAIIWKTFYSIFIYHFNITYLEITKKLEYCFQKYFSKPIVYAVFFTAIFYSLHFNNPICKAATKSLLELIGQDKYTSPVQIYGYDDMDTLTMSLIKDTNNKYRIETRICIKGDKETETCLKKEGLIQLFKESQSVDYPVYIFRDTSWKNGSSRDFIKIAAGSSSCFEVFALIDSVKIEDFERRILNPEGVFMKVLVIPDKKKSSTYVQHLQVKSIRNF